MIVGSEEYFHGNLFGGFLFDIATQPATILSGKARQTSRLPFNPQSRDSPKKNEAVEVELLHPKKIAWIAKMIR